MDMERRLPVHYSLGCNDSLPHCSMEYSDSHLAFHPQLSKQRYEVSSATNNWWSNAKVWWEPWSCGYMCTWRSGMPKTYMHMEKWDTKDIHRSHTHYSLLLGCTQCTLYHMPGHMQWASAVLNNKHVEYGLPELPSASWCMNRWILDVCHISCHSVSSSSQSQALEYDLPELHGVSCCVHLDPTEYRLHLAYPSNASRCKALFPPYKHSVQQECHEQRAVSPTMSLICSPEG